MATSADSLLSKATRTVPKEFKQEFDGQWDDLVASSRRDPALHSEVARRALRSARLYRLRSWGYIFRGSRGWLFAVLAWVIVLGITFAYPYVAGMAAALLMVWAVGFPYVRQSWVMLLGLAIAGLAITYIAIAVGVGVEAMDQSREVPQWARYGGTAFGAFLLGWILFGVAAVMAFRRPPNPA